MRPLAEIQSDIAPRVLEAAERYNVQIPLGSESDQRVVATMLILGRMYDGAGEKPRTKDQLNVAGEHIGLCRQMLRRGFLDEALEAAREAEAALERPV